MHEQLLGAERALQVALWDEQDLAMHCMKRVVTLNLFGGYCVKQ